MIAPNLKKRIVGEEPNSVFLKMMSLMAIQLVCTNFKILIRIPYLI